ncbi:transporter [Roseiconus nitratireducens]|uniref:Transporter n=1 Tax=Roseiconus nitratireducens TaxID=2605748 RepID=A0A5M6D7T1_9BACT|nr:TolC family protein [Roseiconus nitratireducens]KAA5543614.1 transporter [Roseiconus nitratireducens]
MNSLLFRIAANVQLALAIVLATGCTPTQPFFVNESPDLQHYLNSATSIEYPDVEVASLAETTQALPPLTLGNHDYEFWNLSLEECVSIALENARIFPTTGGTAELRQNIAAQFVSGTPDQFGSIYDVAVQQTTTQSVPLTTDGNGNRLLPRGVVRANQVGGVEDALAEFDAVASGFIDLSTTDRPQNVGANNTINPQNLVAQNTTQQAALSKRLATGGVATLRQQTLYSRNNTPINANARAVPSDYTAVLEAQVQHPLMRNRGTYINRIPVVLASLNEDISIAEFEGQIRNLVRDVEVAYWDLYLAYRNVSTGIIARNSALATAEFAKLNLEAGVGTIQELAQAVGQYYTFRGRLEAALAGSNLPGDDRNGVYGRERALRELMGLSATDGRLIRPIQEPTVARVEFEWTDSIAQMLYLMPELRRTKYRIKQAELEMALAKNQVLPDVNLSLLYRWVGVGDTLGPPGRRDQRFPAAGSSALGELTSGDYQEGAVRLEISQPVGVRRELARIRNTQIRLKREKIYLQDQERFAVSQLSDAVALAASHYGLIRTNAQRWQAAEQEVETRLVEYQKGLSPVNVVLQSQERLAEARVAYYRALTEYNKSLNYVDYLKGTLLANSNITLREGPWNSKAYCDALERARERAAGHQLQYGVTRPEVVRRGPVKDAEAAVGIMGLSDNSEGQLVPGQMIPGANAPMDLEPSVPGLNAPQGLNAPNQDAPVPVEDIPLGEMGTPAEMFEPAGEAPSLEPLSQPRNAAPAGQGEKSILTPEALPAPSGNQAVAPMSYQTPVGTGLRSGGSAAPAPVNRIPLGQPLPGQNASGPNPSGQTTVTTAD